MIIFDIIIFIYLLIKFILKYFYNKLSINYFLFFILILIYMYNHEWTNK